MMQQRAQAAEEERLSILGSKFNELSNYLDNHSNKNSY